MSKTPSLRKAAKGLAGALAIASSTSAYGSIVFVNPPPDLAVGLGGHADATWDVNGDGTFDFIFHDTYPIIAPGAIGIVWQATILPQSFFPFSVPNEVMSYSGQFVQYAYALHYGALIAPGDPRFPTQPSRTVLGSKYSYGSAGTNYYGGFAAGGPNDSVHPGTLAFAGFSFVAADGVHYGWIRLSVNAGIIDFADAAYESTPNQAIPTALVPEPGTLALLAIGAFGVLGAVTKRRRE